jgi:hypothetical protein
VSQAGVRQNVSSIGTSLFAQILSRLVDKPVEATGPDVSFEWNGLGDCSAGEFDLIAPSRLFLVAVLCSPGRLMNHRQVSVAVRRRSRDMRCSRLYTPA